MDGPTESPTSDAEIRRRRTSALRSFLGAWVAIDALYSIVALLVGVIVVFIVIDHPYRLLLAMVLELPVLRPLARMFFTTTDQFIEDYGLTTDEGLITQFLGLREIEGLYGRFASGPTIDLGIIWFVVSCASVIAAVYNLLGFVLTWSYG